MNESKIPAGTPGSNRAEPRSVRHTGLTEEEKAQIRAEEAREAERQSYRESVRREAGEGDTFRVVWERVLGLFKVEPGTAEKIAMDSKSTLHSIVVFLIAYFAMSLGLWMLGMPLIICIMVLPIPAALFAVIAGMHWLYSRHFAIKRPTYIQWLRVVLYTSAPLAFGIVPLVGLVFAAPFFVLLQLVVVRGTARISPESAVLCCLSELLVFLLVVPLGFLMGTAAAVGAVQQAVDDLFSLQGLLGLLG